MDFISVHMFPPFVCRLITVLALCAFCLSPGRADIVINELVNAASDRVLKWDANGVPRLGTGVSWYQAAFTETAWQTGTAPFGFGTFATSPTTAIATNLQTQMYYLTPSVYLRKTFTVSAGDAAKTDPLELVVEYNDGFVVYVNGVEAARRWGGATNQFLPHDHPAFDPNLNDTAADTTRYTETVNLGAANTRLVAGTNIIAVQALNISTTSTNFLFSGVLRIGGASPVTLVGASEQWRYFPGTVEPSGGLFDPALLTSGRLSVAWGLPNFVDTTWGSGPGPLGVGIGGLGTNVGGGLIGVTPSLYTRIIFNVSAAQAADTSPLQLLVDYDDSYVAYINGVEVSRANLQTPNTFVTNDAVANASRPWNNGNQTTVSIDAANKVLVAGANVLAIQVHNVTVADAEVAIKADLRTFGGTPLVTNTDTWRYFIGSMEPVASVSGSVEDNPDEPDSVTDWVELHNNGATPVSLNGWRITDDSDNSSGWNFPNVTILPGEYLVVICDGEGIKTPAANGFLHTDFGLDKNGEYLALRNNTGAIVQEFSPKTPPGHPHYSWGRNASGQYVYFDLATPGMPNSGTELSEIVATPTFGVPGGFYSAGQSVTLNTTTSGANIRYTLDGSEPTETTGVAYGGSISVSASSAIRARAFKAGAIPSRTATQTYLINEPSPRPTLPAVTITGDEQRSLYRPFGVMAIKNAVTTSGGNFGTGEGNPWTAQNDPLQYNNPNRRGKFGELPVVWQMLYPSGAPGFTTEIGLRMAGSPFTRPRYTLPEQNRDVNPNSGAWNLTNALRKPSMNFYMRDDFGGDPLDFPVITNSPVTEHSDFRFRAGHNDLNPFIIDELMRRLHVDTGQPGSLGINANLYINGVWKGIYNLCQHVRQEWCREAFNSDLDWDVVQVAQPSDGDLIDYQEMFTFLRNNPQNVLANYQAMETRVNMVNFIDYLLVNIYGCTGDWPHNNWIAGRERSINTANGRWHFFTWDAEGAIGSFNLTVVSNNFVVNPQNNGASGNQSSLNTASPQTESLGAASRVLYTLLKASPEFRLLFADRIQKHFFNNGALTDAKVLARKEVLRTECQPFISGFNNTRMDEWVNGKGDTTRWTVTRNATSPFSINTYTNTPSRRRVLLQGFTNDDTGTPYLPVGTVQGYFITEGLFPATLAPTFSQHGGTVAPNFQLTITNPNPTPSDPKWKIYYTTDGSDPRAAGGGIVGTQYTSAITITQTLNVKARVLDTALNEWSPLADAVFTINAPPTLLITEIMYDPPDIGGVSGSEYEFLELKNTGINPLNLSGWRFTDGIEFDFPVNATLAGGAFAVLVKNPTRFAERYPGVPIYGSFPTTSLNNGGETITLLDVGNNVVSSFTYDNAAPWPPNTSATGFSIVSVLPNSNPDPSNAANWRTSTNNGGSPGADDPLEVPPTLQITEVLANPAAGQTDAIEIFNPTIGSVNIKNWYLSDVIATPKKYRVLADTVVPGNGYRVISEPEFNPTPGQGNSFELPRTGGAVVLSSGDAAGNLTGSTASETFGPSNPGVSFGRHITSQNVKKFVAQSALTLGMPNSGPRVGPVVMTEIVYNSSPDFIELRNVSDSAVQMFDPANPSNRWRIFGVDFVFPQITLQPQQVAIVTAVTEASFRTTFPSLPAAVAVYQWPTGQGLLNTTELVALQQPAAPVAGQPLSYIDIDSVTYNSGTGWPAAPRTLIMRRYWSAFADDPASWFKGTATGNPGFGFTFAEWQTGHFTTSQVSDPNYGGINGNPDGDAYTNFWEFAHGFNPLSANLTPALTATLANDGAAGPFLTLEFRRNPATHAEFFADTAGEAGAWNLGAAVQVGSAVINGDGTESVTMRDTVSTTAAAQRFIRLRVVGN